MSLQFCCVGVHHKCIGSNYRYLLQRQEMPLTMFPISMECPLQIVGYVLSCLEAPGISSITSGGWFPALILSYSDKCRGSFQFCLGWMDGVGLNCLALNEEFGWIKSGTNGCGADRIPEMPASFNCVLNIWRRYFELKHTKMKQIKLVIFINSQKLFATFANNSVHHSLSAFRRRKGKSYFYGPTHRPHLYC